MTEYKIIEEALSNSIMYASNIDKKVQALIRDGWQPAGEICLSNFSYDDKSGTTWIAQSMIKKAGNITDYILIYVNPGVNSIAVENYLLKGYELFGSLKSVGHGIYYQVVIKRIYLIPEIL